MRRGGSRPFLVIPAKARYPGLEHYRLGRNRFSVALPGLDPGIHVFLYRGANQDVAPRAKPAYAARCRSVLEDSATGYCMSPPIVSSNSNEPARPQKTMFGSWASPSVQRAPQASAP